MSPPDYDWKGTLCASITAETSCSVKAVMRASTLLTRSLTSFTSIASSDTSLSELHGAARNRYLGPGENVAVLGVHGVLLGIPLPLVSVVSLAATATVAFFFDSDISGAVGMLPLLRLGLTPWVSTAFLITFSSTNL